MKQWDKRKNDLSIKKEKSYKKLKRYEDLSDLKYMIEGNYIKPFSLKEIESKEVDVDKFALSLKEAFIEAETQLTDVTRGTKEYYQLLRKKLIQKILNKLLKSHVLITKNMMVPVTTDI